LGVDDTIFNPITLKRLPKSGNGFIEIKIIKKAIDLFAQRVTIGNRKGE